MSNTTPGSPDPVDQPLWRGQQAPVEGTDPRPPRSRQRRWLHPVTLTVFGVVLLGLFAGVVTLTARLTAPDRLRLADLQARNCITSKALLDGARDLDDLARVPCGRRHDAEVFDRFNSDSDVTDLTEATQRCIELLDPLDPTLTKLTERGLEVRSLAASADLEPGTRVVCIVRNRSGTPFEN